MSVFLFLFLSISFSPLFTAAGVGIATADCTPKFQRGPKIQFPFRIRSNHSDHCGYPGFDLDCDENGEAVLVLPSSVSLRVKKINYKTQQLHLYDPQECLALKLPNLTLSASPFQFWDWKLDDYALFNCSPPSRDYTGPISCLSDPSYNMHAVDYSSYMDSLSLTSCTRFQNISMVPRDVFYGNDVYLKWDEPACGVCENKDQGCRFKNGTRGNETECFFRDNHHKGLSKKERIAVASTGAFLGVLTIVAVVYLCIVIIRERENQKKVETFLEDYRGLKPTRFCYSDIRRITNEFSEKLGEGGYGVVYKGKLSKEISVAVKVLNNSKEKGEEFVNEVSTIGRIHHVNVVRLVGFCAEGFRRVVVYEFLPNDSLEKFIFQTESKRRALGLEKLQNIALGIAKGIEYLHQGCDQQILHFDIKPHNILLDQNFNPKICDFGLAKLCSKEQSGVTMTAARGTMGYIAPEVLSRTFGKVSYKSDVYSFGMLLLEMVGGRKNVDPKVNASQVYFPLWIYNHLNLGEELWTRANTEENGANTEENGEGYGDGDDDGNVANKLTIIGLSCIQWYPSDRPSMKEVVQMLEGDGSDLTMPPNPFPDGNVPNLVSGLPDKRFQIELPLILESDE